MSMPGNHVTRSMSWGASAVLTAGSKPNQRPSERRNVRTVVTSAVQRTAPSLGTNSATTAPRAGRKITHETRCGIEARKSMLGVQGSGCRAPGVRASTRHREPSDKQHEGDDDDDAQHQGQ